MTVTCSACGRHVPVPPGFMVTACSCGQRIRTDGGGQATTAGLDPFEILGIPPDSDRDKIRRAYRQRARETHPDHGGDPDEFQAVQMAWEALRDDQQRHNRRRARSAGVPDIIGMNAIGAIARLRAQGLLPAIAIAQVDNQSPLIGLVVACSPSPGAARPTRGVVQVVVAMSDPSGLRQKIIASGRGAATDLRSGFATAWAHRQAPPDAETASPHHIGQRLGYGSVRLARGAADTVRLLAYALAVTALVIAAVVIGVIRPVAGLIVLVLGISIVCTAWVRGQRRRRARRAAGTLL